MLARKNAQSLVLGPSMAYPGDLRPALKAHQVGTGSIFLVLQSPANLDWTELQVRNW